MTALFVQEQFRSWSHFGEMKNVRSFSPKQNLLGMPLFFLFVMEGRRILNTHFEETIIIGFGILDTPGNHIYEIATLCDSCPEWQVHFIMHGNLID